MSLVDESDVLPEVGVPLAAHWTRGALLLVHVGQVPLQVSLQVAAVATRSALVVLQLKHTHLWKMPNNNLLSKSMMAIP